MRKTLLIIMTITLMATVLLAQPPRGDMSPKNMDAIRIWKLTEILELTEEQTVTFLPLVQIHERKLREAQKEMIGLAKKGHKVLDKKEITQKDVDKLIKKYTESQEKIHGIKRDFIESLPKYLSPKQQLLYISFETRFRQDLRQYMKDRRGRRGPDSGGKP